MLLLTCLPAFRLRCRVCFRFFHLSYSISFHPRANQHRDQQRDTLETNKLACLPLKPLKPTHAHSLAGVRDPSLRLEPSATRAQLGEFVEFTCIVPANWSTQKARFADAHVVTWRRNGYKLDNVRVFDAPYHDVFDRKWRPQQYRYSVARRSPTRSPSSSQEYMLRVSKLEPSDNQTSYTCAVQFESSLEGSLVDDEGGQLAHESNEVLLNVLPAPPIKIDVHGMGPPFVDGFDDEIEPTHHRNQEQNNSRLHSQQQANNNTTHLSSGAAANGPRRVATLSETLFDLYRLANMPLFAGCFFSLMALIALVQLAFLRCRRARADPTKYLKHRHSIGPHSYASSSGASATSASSMFAGAASFVENNSGGGANNCDDPMLSSLLARTLSGGQGCIGVGGAMMTKSSKKSYRQHMRKVAVAQEQHNFGTVPGDEIDFADVAATYFNHNSKQAPRFNHDANQASSAFHLGTNGPLLYNQSVAARDQARALLQSANGGGGVGEAPGRSLSNLHQQVSHSRHYQQQQQHSSSHLNLNVNLAASNDFNDDQLSPYAVSSICTQGPMLGPPPNEAMRALGEQFDIKQLILLEDRDTVSIEPPPPPPQQNCDHGR